MRKFLSFTVVRLILALAFVLLPVIGMQLLLGAALGEDNVGFVVVLLSNALMACVGYLLYVRLIEQRPCTELAPGAIPKQLGGGLLIGALLFTATIGVLWLADAYEVVGTGPLSNLVVPLAVGIGAGVFEEILFRGVIFRLIERSLGSWLALIISAALFGAVHLSNPNATLLSGAAIAIEAGVLLAAAFMLTRSLWLPIGIHIAWNAVQGGIFGVAVSGTDVKGLLLGKLSGPEWLSGGEFGAEASVVAIVLCLGVGIFYLVKAKQRNHFVAPFWRRGSDTAVAQES